MADLVKVRSFTPAERAALPSPTMNFVPGVGFTRMMQKDGSVTNDFGGLPPNPVYNTYLSRDLTTSNLAEEGLRRNSLIFGILTAKAVAVQQAPIKLYDPNDKQFSEPIEGTMLGSLLDYVNPLFDFAKLMAWSEGYRHVGGAAYWHMVRDKYGVIEQIFPYHASQIKPIPGQGSWIKNYVYDNGADFKFEIWPEDMISFWWPIPDFNKPWQPWSPLAALAGEIDVDNERKDAEFRALLNGATPSVIVEVGQGDAGRPPTQAQLDILSERFQVRFGGKNKYKAMMAPPGTKAYALGFSPKDLVLNIFAQIPETRACHVLDWPIQVTSLQAASAAKTYKNFGEARRSAYQDCIIPIWQLYEKALTKFFSKEIFPGKKQSLVAKFDISEIIPLHEDATANVVSEFSGNLLTLDEARSELDWEPDVSGKGDKYAYELTAPVGAPEMEAANEERMIQQAEAGHGRVIQRKGKK